MSTKDLLPKSVGWAMPLFGALCLLACGGSAMLSGDGGGSAGGGSASGGSASGGSGSTGAAGGAVCNDVACSAIACGPDAISVSVPGQCCPSCEPLAGGSGGTGSGGSAAAGTGSGGCGVTACPRVACEPGWTAVTEAGQCCPTCVPAMDGGAGGCAAVDCAAVACAKGYISSTQPGACCPICVLDSQACTAGQQGYQSLLGSLLQQPGATSCSVDTDCTTLPGLAQCGDDCSISTVNASLEPDMENQLNLWASSYCSTCMGIAVPCLPQAIAPFCSAGQCQLYHAL